MKVERQSETILRLLDAAQEVEDSVTHHDPHIARRLEERFAPRFAHLGEGQRPNFLATLFALRDELAASRRAGGRRRRVAPLRPGRRSCRRE